MKKTNIIVTSAALVLTMFASTSQAGYIEPGSESDPLVSKSYVEQKFNEAKKDSDLNKEKLEKIEKDIEKLVEDNRNNSNKPGNSGSSQTSGDVFKVLELKKGQTILADESAEIIVRSGTVSAIGSENGGISDITDGKDLTTGEGVDLNHLLIIPRSDGRGVKVEGSLAFIMVKGGYSLK